MPELSGADATKGILANIPNAKIMILTSFGTSVEMAAAIANGTVGALMKDTATDDLVAAIRTVIAGGTVIPQRLLKAAQTIPDRPKLSERQLAIFASVTNGFSNADIARQFNLSEITVKKHLSSVFAKLGASNRSEAVAIALRLNLLHC